MRALQDAIPVGGRLRFFWRRWQEIGASRRVCRWFRKGYALPFLPDCRDIAISWCSVVSPPFLIANYKAFASYSIYVDNRLLSLM